MYIMHFLQLQSQLTTATDPVNKRKYLLQANQYSIPNTVPNSTSADDSLQLNAQLSFSIGTNQNIPVPLSIPDYTNVNVTQLATSLSTTYNIPVDTLTSAINDEITNTKTIYSNLCTDLDDQITSVLNTMTARLTDYDAAMQVIKDAAANPDNKQTNTQLANAYQALLGKSFPLLHRFSSKNNSDLTFSLQTLNVQFQNAQRKFNPIIWFQQTSTTHPELQKLEHLLMLAEGIQSLADPTSSLGQINVQLRLQVAQLPINLQTKDTPPKPINDWLCLPLSNAISNLQDLQGCTSIVFNSITPIDFTDVSGIVIDSWDETIPFPMVDTAYAYQYTKPNALPPQTLLLLNAPDSTYKGTVDQYVYEAILDTLDLAKIRTVDLEAMKWLGTFLPAIFIPQYTTPDLPTVVKFNPSYTN